MVDPERVPAGSVIAGGDMRGVAAATGKSSRATATYIETAAPDPTVDIRAELAALMKAYGALPGVDQRAVSRLEEANTETKKDVPDRDDILDLVIQATKYAKKAETFASEADKFIPFLKKIASWLGRGWDFITSAAGL
jgi:hypothetical protein